MNRVIDNRLIPAEAGSTEVCTVPATPGFYTIEDGDQVKYVGSTQNLKQRFTGHNRRLRVGEHENQNLQKLSDEAGPLKFSFVPTETKEVALDMEQAQLGQPGLCNIAVDARAAQKGIVRTEEHRQNLSKALTGRKLSPETCAKMSEAKKGHTFNVGRKQTPESIEKRRASLMGHLVSAETRAKIGAVHVGNQYTKGSKLTQEHKDKLSASKGHAVVIEGVPYRSANHAARELGVHPQTVLNRCANTSFAAWNKE